MSKILEGLAAFQHLKQLEVKVYKGLHLNADNMDTSIIDQWINQEKSSPADLERLLNHIHVYDFFPDVQDEEELDRAATEIVCSWEKILSDLDPRYCTLMYKGYGPEITFYFNRDT